MTRYCELEGSGVPCPRNDKGLCFKYARGEVNADCSIKDETRPRSKTVKIKAWAWIKDGKFITADYAENGDNCTPCTVIIARKYMGGRNETKIRN